MKCKHYEGDGYTYNLPDKQTLDLCNNCERELLAEMMKQKIIEDKLQVETNIMFEKEIQKLKEPKR